MKRFLKVIKTLSDPNQVTIIKMLQTLPFRVCEMQGCPWHHPVNGKQKFENT
jgi:hypothetical protein